MRESDAQRRAILSLLDVVEELAIAVGEREWSEAVTVSFRDHRREILASLPDRLVAACGGSEEAAARVLSVLERASDKPVTRGLGARQSVRIAVAGDDGEDAA